MFVLQFTYDTDDNDVGKNTSECSYYFLYKSRLLTKKHLKNMSLIEEHDNTWVKIPGNRYSKLFIGRPFKKRAEILRQCCRL